MSDSDLASSSSKGIVSTEESTELSSFEISIFRGNSLKRPVLKIEVFGSSEVSGMAGNLDINRERARSEGRKSPPEEVEATELETGTKSGELFDPFLPGG
jgi:hypothetical protein